MRRCSRRPGPHAKLKKDSKGRPKMQTNRTAGNQFAGRVVGGAVGQMLCVFLVMLTLGVGELIGKGASGVGMGLFLAGWSAFIHMFEAIGRQCDHANRRRAAEDCQRRQRQRRGSN